MENRMEELTEQELRILFHALGYSFEPRWFEGQKEPYRNAYVISAKVHDDTIFGLTEKGYLYPLRELCEMRSFAVTEKGIELVKKLFEEKKQKIKPKKKSTRRYEAYCWNREAFGDFRKFLFALKEDSEEVRNFKKKWDI